MTYGWAILIIAVVLGALYYLGVFNSSNLATRAQPGSCKVIRPNGPGTTTYINLAGVCTGQLPLFVAMFNGQSSHVDVGTGANLGITTGSVGLWAYINSLVGTHDTLLVKGSSAGWVGMHYAIKLSTGNLQGVISDGTHYQNPLFGSYNLKQWTYAVMTWDGLYIRLYINGGLVSNTPQQYVPPSSVPRTVMIGENYDSNYPFSGFISNVQIYNTSLSDAEIQGLYAEGIGGAPTRLQNLVGWWPLNEDANDYSGNGNNGAATNVIFTSTWTK